LRKITPYPESTPRPPRSGARSYASRPNTPRDGRPVTDPHQTLAEKFYWMEVGFGEEGLVHDEETQEFFTPEGEIALSRDFVHLERLMGDERKKAWESEIA